MRPSLIAPPAVCRQGCPLRELQYAWPILLAISTVFTERSYAYAAISMEATIEVALASNRYVGDGGSCGLGTGLGRRVLD